MLFILLTLLFCQPFLSQLSMKKKSDHCWNVSTIPMWSWGFTRRCCDIYPFQIGRHQSTFEGGSPDDPKYFLRRLIKNGSVVFVASSDFPQFLHVFKSVPLSHRLVVVTGLEDVGVPWELYRNGRKEWDVLWGSKEPVISLKQFVLDPRLVRWYTQNLDIGGCTPFYCMKETKDSDTLLEKIVPIPIGLDFHSEAGKSNLMLERGAMENHEGVCRQRQQLAAVLGDSPPLPDRPLRLLAAFTCKLPKWQREAREGLCQLITRFQSSGIKYSALVAPSESTTTPLNLTFKQGSRQEFWNEVSSHAFVLAPAGHGMDTHRLWEVLNLHSIPITLTSPLDSLYSQFPVVIVSSWQEVFVPGALKAFLSRIQTTFGRDPFASAEISAKLTAKYWAVLVRSQIRGSD